MNRRKILLFLLFSLSACFNISAESKKTEQDDNWVISAMPFVFINSNSDDATELAVAKNLPSLILGQISSETVRMQSNRELLNQKLSDLQKERLALFLELSKAEKTRDSLVLENYSKRKFKKLLKNSDNEIEEIHKKITENLEKDVQYSLTGQLNLQEKRGILSFFKKNKDVSAAASKKLAIYKNDPYTLFSEKSANQDEDAFYSSYDFEQKVISAGIDCLLTGTITSYGGYAAVTAELRTYPGGSLCASVTEVGLLSSPVDIAQKLTRSLTPALSNKMPVELKLKVEPESIKDKVTVNVDGIVFSDCPDTIVVDSGEHVISFEAEGYKKNYITYLFNEKRSYSVTAKMEEHNPKKITFELIHPLNSASSTAATGVLSSNAINSFKLTEQNNSAGILIDDKPVILHYLSDDGLSTFFYLPLEILEKTDSVAAKPLDYDVSENIEKCRRRMYTAYSALIISLPFSFYYYGTYINKLNGNIAGSPVAADDVNSWRKKAMTSVCISTSLGAIFGFELVKYLHSTNAVLPKSAKPKKVKNRK